MTSTLQQEASRKLRFSVKRTMMLAQRLYEGVGLGKEGSVGLITYMRTDSTAMAGVAMGEARDVIRALFDALRARGVEEIYSTPDEDNQAAMWIHRVLNFEKRGTQIASHGKRQSVFVLKLAGESRS